MSESRQVKKKKRWGKSFTYTPTKRAPVLSEELAKDIENDLKKAYVTTPNQFAIKHGITISLAKRILKDYADRGKITQSFSNSNNQIYS